MIGRRVIETNRAFTLEELNAFMSEHWDTARYNGFTIGRPTAASVEQYILLPATERYMVIVFSRKKGGLFRKTDRVILSVCDTPAGAKENVMRSLVPASTLIGPIKLKSAEEERKGPAEAALEQYTQYMTGLLGEAGCLLR